MSYDIFQNDILEWASEYDGPLFHAALMDAPYEMEFMGKGWDNSGIALNPETWRLIARCLSPGAFLMVCAGTINDDLISVAMRQAGLRKYHRAMAWGYGSGFPKSTRLDAQIDRAAGESPRVVGTRKHAPKWVAAELGYREKDNGYNSTTRETFDVTEPATELAQAWSGHRYGGQMLKPALESILIFQKPYAGRPIDSITRTGAGALNIDKSRIPIGDGESLDGGGYQTPCHEGWDRPWKHNLDIREEKDNLKKINVAKAEALGRWPANLILSHSPECTDDGCVSGCPVRALGEQSGESESNASQRGAVNIGTFGGVAGSVYGTRDWRDDYEVRGHDDSGTAARFFYNADWMYERLEAADSLIYIPKASTAEREAGLVDFDPTTVDDGRKTSIDNAYLRGETMRRNIHPTVKPISLARHLATLLLPPDCYAPRRLLIPFAGVASEMIGAMLAGWEDVIGIELEAAHVRIAEARIAYWSQMRHRAAERAIKPRIKKADSDQLELF